MSLRTVKDNGLEAQQLKETYLRCFGARTNTAAALQEAVKGLIDRGFCRKTLFTWAVEAGYRRAYISCMLTRILRALGFRERRAGAGRKPSRDALELLAHAKDKYVKRRLKVLRSAQQAGKAETLASIGKAASNSGGPTTLLWLHNCEAQKLIAVPQLNKVDVGHAKTVSASIRLQQ